MWSGIIANTVVLQSNLTLTHSGLAHLVLSSEQSFCSKSILINLMFNLVLAGLGLMVLQGLVPVRRGVFLLSEHVPRYCPQQDWFCGSRSGRRVTTDLLRSRKSEESGRKVLAPGKGKPSELVPPLSASEHSWAGKLRVLGVGLLLLCLCSYSGRNGLLRS